jgi:hypothetical protein
MKAWLTDTDDTGKDAKAAPPSTSVSSTAEAPPQQSSPSTSAVLNAASTVSTSAVSISVVSSPQVADEDSGCSDAKPRSASETDATVTAAAPEDEATTKSSVTPLHLSIENIGQGWRSIFSNAKDCWDIADKEEGRGVFWHTESGCCFEWHQSIGMLLQFGEEDEQGKPQKFPVWSLDCPEQSAWIWDTLPLPPTDPAAQPEDERPAVEAAGETAAPQLAAPEMKSPAAGGMAGDMLPPPVPFKKRPRPEAVSKAPVALGDDDDDDGAAFTTVLDDNIWERRCLALERRAAAKAASSSATSSCSSSASGSASDAAAASCSSLASLAAVAPGGVAAALKAVEASSGSSAEEQEGVRDLPAPPMDSPDARAGLLDDDSDEDAVPGAGPLASEGPAPVLPSAPADRAKPKACDLDLDMFGEPEEDSMEAVD